MINEKLTLRERMKDTWLIQRLEAPVVRVVDGKRVDNPFSFGGGLKNGGLSENAMAVVRDLFSFDYMGAAEFEFGAVPAALHFLMEQATYKNLITHFINVGNKKTPEWVYYICPKEYESEVVKRIILLRKDKIRLKEYSRLDRVFEEGTTTRTKGWLELDNGFMFFVDREMAAKVWYLFELNMV